MGEPKELFEILRGKEEGLKSIVNSLPFPVAVYNDRGEFLAINPAWSELSGYPFEMIPSVEAWMCLATMQRREAARQLITDNFKLDRMTHKGEFPVRTAQGEERVWDFYAGPIGMDRQGRRLVMSTAVDVTDRVRAETALREREEELAQANRRKDEFLATLSHELRNPLAPIRTGLEALKVVGDKPELREEVRAMMERQTLQLISLVNDLMEVSRITRGKLTLRRKRVSLSEVVQSALEAFRPFLQTTQLTVDLPREELYLDVDPHRLAQVLSNLLNNAFQYTPENGAVELRAEKFEDFVLISVKDNGIGIPQDKLNEIFQPFAQLDHLYREGYEGLGIGLHLAQTLVNLHGGDIWAESKGENQGSTFTLKLPLFTEGAEEAV